MMFLSIHCKIKLKLRYRAKLRDTDFEIQIQIEIATLIRYDVADCNWLVFQLRFGIGFLTEIEMKIAWRGMAVMKINLKIKVAFTVKKSCSI